MLVLSRFQAIWLFTTTWHFCYAYSRIAAVGWPDTRISMWAKGFMHDKNPQGSLSEESALGKVLRLIYLVAQAEIERNLNLRRGKDRQKGMGETRTERFVFFRQRPGPERPCFEC